MDIDFLAFFFTFTLYDLFIIIALHSTKSKKYGEIRRNSENKQCCKQALKDWFERSTDRHTCSKIVRENKKIIKNANFEFPTTQEIAVIKRALKWHNFLIQYTVRYTQYKNISI